MPRNGPDTDDDFDALVADDGETVAVAVADTIARVTRDGDAGALLRAARRRGHRRQRELAAAAGVSLRTIERGEAGGVIQVPRLAGLLAAVRCQLVAVDALSRPLLSGPADAVFDRGGRHYPAHLDVRTTGPWRDWWGDLPFSTYARPEYAPRLRPIRTFDRSRAERDWKRAHPPPPP
jgi:transcriptional regulator with XRE-family HTH domain